MTRNSSFHASRDGLRVGILGGSFNPAHAGHVEMSLFAIKRLKLDQVWWLVSPQNPLKTRDEMQNYERRLAQARALATRHKKIVVSDFEQRHKTTFTIDTLCAIKRYFPKMKIVWLMGEDNLQTFHLWKSWRQIFVEVPIAVFRRSGYSESRVRGGAQAFFASAMIPLASAKSLAEIEPPAWVVLDNELNPLSATQIRQLSKSKVCTNSPNEGALKMVVKKAAKKVAKKPAKKVAKKPAKKAVKKVVKKVAKKKPAAKKKAAKK